MGALPPPTTGPDHGATSVAPVVIPTSPRVNHREHGGHRGLTVPATRSSSRLAGIGRMGGPSTPQQQDRISARKTWSDGNHSETLRDLRVLCGEPFPPSRSRTPGIGRNGGPSTPNNRSGSWRNLRGPCGDPHLTPSEPQRTRRTQRVDGSHDTLLVSRGRHRQDGGALPPPNNKTGSQRARRGATGIIRRPSATSVFSVVNPSHLPDPGPRASAGWGPRHPPQKTSS